MARLKWDQIGQKLYETGVEMGVLFPQNSSGEYDEGVAWNGLSNVSESPSGAEATAIYANNGKYLNLLSNEELGLSIEAYTYPDEFAACDGMAELATGVVVGQQNRQSFGLCYKTLIGNDVKGTSYGYKLHIAYGCLASPSEKAYATENDSPEAVTFSWEVTTTPVEVPGHKASSSITIDSTKVDPDKLKAIEDIIYGVDEDTGASITAKVSRLPLPAEIIQLLQ